MEQDEIVEFYLCPGCLTPGDTPGSCHVCGAQRLQCCPGEPNDPCRRPLIDGGMVRTHAPMWWLQHSVTRIAKQKKEENKD
jgi:hypothetical protein